MAAEHPTAEEWSNPNQFGKDDSLRSFVNAAIARAKQEWECTVDALPQLVCVLDGNCNIVRANRAIETWALGKVRAVAGRPVHQLLHPECDGRNCTLAEQLATSWQALPLSGASSFEMHDPLLSRVLSVTLRRMAAADDARGSDDLSVIVFSDITELHRVQADLRLMNEQLETRIAERTRELNVSRDELSILSNQLMTTQESERKRIAQELHDSIGQSLSAVKYTLERVVEMTYGRDAGAARPLLTTTITRVQETVESIRSIAMNLRPSMLDDLGAVSAVRWFCREFRDVYAQIKVHTDLSASDDSVPEHLGTPIFRIVQESLSNAAKHAHASNIFVSLRFERGTLMLEIRDDGVGFDVNEIGGSPQRGHGLSGLRERASKTGGLFSLRSKRRAGTVVRVGWPLERGAAPPVLPVTHKGFTLLELLVVMVIIGILAGFVAPRYFAQVGKSQVKAARAQIDALDKALDQFRIDIGRYPSNEEGLDALTSAPPNEPDWTGPYLKKAVPLDPWGHPFVYVSPGLHADVDLLSYGKDGQPGGSGENADLSNW